MTIEEYCKMVHMSREHYDKCPECKDQRQAIIQHAKDKADQLLYQVRLAKAKEQVAKAVPEKV